MKATLDISTLAIDELSYPSVEMVSKLLRILNVGKADRLSLQDPDVIVKIRKELLSNKSISAMELYVELLKEIKASQEVTEGVGGMEDLEEGNSRSAYKTIDPRSFNKSFKEELATGEYRSNKKGRLA